MKEKDIIRQLESLKINQRDFVDNSLSEEDDIFKQDVKALDCAIKKLNTTMKQDIFHQMDIMGWNLNENKYSDFDDVYWYHLHNMEYWLEHMEDRNWLAYINQEDLKNMLEFTIDMMIVLNNEEYSKGEREI